MRQNKKDSEKIFFVLKSKGIQNTLRRTFRYHEYFNTKTAFSSIGRSFFLRTLLFNPFVEKIYIRIVFLLPRTNNSP